MVVVVVSKQRSAVILLLFVSASAAALSSDCPPEEYAPPVVDTLNEESLLEEENENQSNSNKDDYYALLEALEKYQGVSKCGAHRRRNANSGRISKGYAAEQGEYPSFAHVESTFNDSSTTGLISTCGGVIITDRLVLTAAHCVIREELANRLSSSRYVGEHIVRVGNIKRGSGFKMTVRSICLTSDGNFKGFDLAILTLSSALKFSRDVQPACMPGSDFSHNQKAHVVGFGMIQSVPKKKRPDLLQVMPVRRRPWCNQPRPWILCLESSSERYRGDICAGDSGGGIYVTVDGRHVAVGIVSGGPLNCRPNATMSFSIATNLFVARSRIVSMYAECARSATPGSSLIRSE